MTIRAKKPSALGLAVVAGSLVVNLPAAPASADDRPPVQPFSVVEFSDQPTPGAVTTLRDQYQRSRFSVTNDMDRRRAFVEQNAREGRYYAPESIDVLHLQRTDGETADLVVPKDYKIAKVELGAGLKPDPGQDGKDVYAVSAGVHGTETGAASIAYPNGPGFDTFGSWSSGQYTLTTSHGKMDAYWWKLKDTETYNSTYDWWMYKRKSVATPKDITGPDDIVHDMGMRSYPTTSTRNILRKWEDWAPDLGSHDWGCGNDVALSVWGVGMTFKTCGTYQVDWNGNNADAGDFSVNWQNIPSTVWSQPKGGPHQMADMVVVKTAQGSVPVYNDYQYVNFWSPITGVLGKNGCGSTNSSANC
ncbi:hypothetical protein [Acrocarpospora catenulata]|uniref:hypothetical protein n=1 Tax=Acrocarpospora catenulata TaxID=2836182 RepID=UPI001BDACEC2|nr:hypothetical protein [Acrocarpospora catenulata]